MHVCQPWTNVPKIHHKTSDPKIFISHICFELCRNSSPRMWANPEPTTQDTLKTSDPRIFISHIPVLNFAGAALHITPCMCANPEPTFQRYTTKPQTLRFSSHTSVLNFAGPRMWANPSWTNVPRHTTKPQTQKFSSHTSLFWTLLEQLSILHHACVPTLNQRSKDTPQNLRPKDFNLTHLFWTLPEQLSMLHHKCEPTHPEPTPQDTPQNLKPQDFHLTHPSFELCRSSSPYYTMHVCQPWTNDPKIHRKTSDPQIFISHICFELCRNSSPCHTTHVSQPILNQRPKTHEKLQIRKFSSHTFLFRTLQEQLSLSSILHHACVPTLNQRSKDAPQNLRPSDFHLTHPCFELCRNSSPCYNTHVSQSHPGFSTND